MDSLGIEGLKDLCLGDELTQTVAAKLGAVPKRSGNSAENLQTPIIDQQDVIKEIPPSNISVKSSSGSVPSTPAMVRKQMKKKNRKDRRRDSNQDVSNCGDEKLGDSVQSTAAAGVRANNARNCPGRGIARSNSARSVPSSTLAQPSPEEITKLLFKSQSTVNVKTGIRNLPDSFFNDDLQEEESKENDEKNKKKRKKKGRKKGGANAAQGSQRKEEETRPESTSDKENSRKGSEEKELIIEDVVNNEDDLGCKEVAEDGFVYNWRNVTKNGDVKKCILVEGNRDEGRPIKGDVVIVKSQGKLKDGTMIDDNPTLVFRVGEYEVVQGLDLCVQSMLKNELAIVSVKPSMAYGELGRKPDIASNSRITYLFGLLHFEKQKDISELTWAQRRKMGQSRMRIANWWYSRKEYSIAVKCYKRALLYYNNIPTDQKCSTTDEYRELLTLMEERLRVMRQVANIFKRIANLIQSGHIET